MTRTDERPPRSDARHPHDAKPGVSRYDEVGLDPRLAADTLRIATLPGAWLLLACAEEVPWWILVPRVVDAVEWVDLDDDTAVALQRNSLFLQRALRAAYPQARLNVGKLGNVVAMLHLHHVVRHAGDPLWPGPVWGRVSGLQASMAQIEERLAALRAHWPPEVAIEWLGVDDHQG